MTYRELKRALDCFNDKQLDCSIAVYDRGSDTFVQTQIVHYFATDYSDALEQGHPFFILRNRTH
jgi:hypothetical protein